MSILEELRASCIGLPAEILARRHDWNPRTVYRDLRALEDAGFPITSTDGRWKLVEGWQRTVPFPLSLGERVALGFARTVMAPLRGTPVARDFEKLYERLAGRHSEKFLRSAFRIWRAESAVTVRLAIEPSDAGWVSERRWHASQRTRRRAGGRSEIELTVDWSIEVKRFILQLGAAVEVMEPAWLRDEIAAEHAAAARRGRRPARRKSLTFDDRAAGDSGRR